MIQVHPLQAVGLLQVLQRAPLWITIASLAMCSEVTGGERAWIVGFGRGVHQHATVSAPI